MARAVDNARRADKVAVDHWLDCPRCHELNDPDRLTCSECGAQLLILKLSDPRKP